MTPEQATKQVAEATAMRKQWGKQYALKDVPTDFLDAVVMEVERLKREIEQARIYGDDKLNERAVAQHDEIVLLKRQLGAAKARETQLRKQLAKAAEAGLSVAQGTGTD